MKFSHSLLVNEAQALPSKALGSATSGIDQCIDFLSKKIFGLGTL
jgi:hypothetical protein